MECLAVVQWELWDWIGGVANFLVGKILLYRVVGHAVIRKGGHVNKTLTTIMLFDMSQ